MRFLDSISSLRYTATMQTLRSFIAAEIDVPIKEKIIQVMKGFKDKVHEGIRWVSDENIHLTLKYFGDIQQDNLTILADALQSACISIPPFKIQLADLGAFPDHHRPRVVWIGVKENVELVNLAGVIENLAIKSGVKAEDRAFSAHITLGRVARSADYLDILKIGETVSSTKVGEVGIQTIHELIIFKSDLQQDGPVYTKIHTLKLGK